MNLKHFALLGFAIILLDVAFWEKPSISILGLALIQAAYLRSIRDGVDKK